MVGPNTEMLFILYEAHQAHLMDHDRASMDNTFANYVRHGQHLAVRNNYINHVWPSGAYAVLDGGCDIPGVFHPLRR